MGWTLSIDFGTTNTAAAYALDGQPPRPVRLSDNADTIPSAVLAGPSGILVGTEAVRSRRHRPECYLESPKLAVGQDAVLLGDDEVPVPELVASVLRHVARRASRFAGSDTPTRVVLTHPHDWAAGRRAALRAAWEATGIAVEEVRLVPEPIAAATCLAIEGQIAVGATIGVFDYGGGTCDVAVLRRTGSAEDPWQVLGQGGAADLGGATLDMILMRWLRDSLLSLGHSDVDAALEHDLAALRTLQDEVRQAKEALSQWPDSEIPVAVGAHSLSVSITAPEFGELIAEEVARARALTERVLEQAGVAPDRLTALYLTGGSSHLLAVHAALEDLLGGRPATLGDPKMVVALGAHAAPTPKSPASPGVTTAPTPASAPSLDGTVRVPASDRPSPTPAGISLATQRLLAAQPALAAAVASLPDGPRLLDDHAVLTAVIAVPGLLEEIIARPARLAELGAGPNGELLEVHDDEATAMLPVRIFFADAAWWQRRLDDAEWRQQFRDSNSGLAWAANVVAAWNELPPPHLKRVLADTNWHPGHAEAEYSWLYTEEETGSVWIASTARSAPRTPAPTSTEPAGFPRPRGLTPQQAAVLARLEPLGAFHDRSNFLRALDGRHSLVENHRSLRIVNDRGAPYRRLYLSKASRSPFVLLPTWDVFGQTARSLLILTPDVVASVRSKTYFRDDPGKFFPTPRAIVQTTSRQGASDPRSGSELHLLKEDDRNLARRIARHLGR